MKLKIIEEIVNKNQLSINKWRYKFFYFLLGLSISNAIIFSYSRNHIVKNLDVLKMEFDLIKTKIYEDEKKI